MKTGRLEIGICLALAFLTIALYARVVDNGFVNYDDPKYIIENARVNTGLTTDNVIWAFSTFHASNWHPLTWLSHMLDSELFGLAPGPHHVVSLLFHTANALLLFLLIHRTTRRIWAGAFIAALFALHPLHVDSVAWAAERKDVLSAFFGLLCLVAYWRYAKVPNIARYAWVFLFLALGLMSKPMLVTWPFVMLLLDYWPLGRLRLGRPESPDDFLAPVSPAKLIAEKLPLLILAGASSVITWIAQQSGGAMETFEYLPLTARLANAIVSYVAYIGQMLWPVNLAVYYPYPGSIPIWKVLFAAILLGLITAGVIYQARRRPYLPVGWFWFLGTMVPVIGIVQVGAQSMADRYTYIPLIGLFIMIVWGVPEVWRRLVFRENLLKAIAGAVLAVLVCLTYIQVGYWRDGLTLFKHAAEVTVNNDLAHYNVANSLSRLGELDEAVKHYKEAIRIKPSRLDAYNNLGIALIRLKKLDEAADCFQKVISVKPDSPDAWTNLGLVRMNRGDFQAAIDCFDQALTYAPDQAMIHNNLGTALWQVGKREEAVRHFEIGVTLAPRDARAQNNLGNALVSLNRLDEALEHYEQAHKIDPGNAEASKNYFGLKTALGRQT